MNREDCNLFRARPLHDRTWVSAHNANCCSTLIISICTYIHLLYILGIVIGLSYIKTNKSKAQLSAVLIGDRSLDAIKQLGHVKRSAAAGYERRLLNHTSPSNDETSSPFCFNEGDSFLLASARARHPRNPLLLNKRKTRLRNYRRWETHRPPSPLIRPTVSGQTRNERSLIKAATRSKQMIPLQTISTRSLADVPAPSVRILSDSSALATVKRSRRSRRSRRS